MAGLKVKKGDTVYILSGEDKGKTGKVLKVNPGDSTIIVEGVAIAVKHKKPRNAQEQGGIIHIEAPINISKAMVVCNSCKKPSKLAVKMVGEGKNEKKVRVCKKCGAEVKTTVNKKEK